MRIYHVILARNGLAMIPIMPFPSAFQSIAGRSGPSVTAPVPRGTPQSLRESVNLLRRPESTDLRFRLPPHFISVGADGEPFLQADPPQPVDGCIPSGLGTGTLAEIEEER
jgi:hypothetical protein